MNKLKLVLAVGALALCAAAAGASVPVKGKDTPHGALSGRNIAVWQSHGRYFDKSESRWKWQRCRLFGTVEDLYTRSYVVPFLVPMLENAGAYVMLPRERDTRRNGVVIDPDGDYAFAGYAERNGKQKWKQAKEPGFGLPSEVLVNGQNPFVSGGYRQVKSVKDARKASTAEWCAALPQRGDYAVYVSYHTVDKSAPAVTYTVHTAIGPREFTVDQSRGGATWIYLGTFPFAASETPQPLVSLSNFTGKDGDIVTADAVRIGGGEGNIARAADDSSPALTSGMPRWAEAARYYLQFAGMPDSVYAHEGDDYKDDIFSRPLWVNHLNDELNIPIDLALAFHSDAGTTDSDETVGTLGIYYTEKRKGKFPDGRPRTLSRALADSVVSSVVRDIRSSYDPLWTRRKMRDAKYIEARETHVPTMLLELLSHQNLADMRYGLDPQFKFDVSRAVYKGILRYLSAQKLAPYIVQPLPPVGCAIAESAGGRFTLSWEPQTDPLEPTAVPLRYIVEERAGADPGEPFRVLDQVSATSLAVEIPQGEIRSYRVIAVNGGGRSFPSEVMSAGHVANSAGTVTVVNGFTRVSGPDSFNSPAMGGFGINDPGVPFHSDLSFTGRQYDFDKSHQWIHDDSPGFGASYADHELKPVPGNTFDFTALHGEAVMAAGYSFISSSVKAFTESDSRPEILDLLMGLQRETVVGTGGRSPAHAIFPVELQLRLENLASQGVPMLLSGSYIGSDLHHSPSATTQGREFARRVFGYEWRTANAAATGSVSEIHSRYAADFTGGKFLFGIALGNGPYDVVSPDAIYPVSPQTGGTVMRYDENGTPAAVAFTPGTHRAFTLGFPFEAIGSRSSRNLLMKQTLRFLTAK